MRKLKVLSGGVVAAAMLATSVTPAMARGYGGFGNGWGHRRHHDNDTGSVLAGVLIGAIAVGIASSASKKAKERREASDGYPARDGRRGSIGTEDAAVDACAQAAEDRGGQSASVRDIDNVRKSSDGWDVEGTLEQREGWRDRTAEKHRFTCSVRYGEVDSVYIDGQSVALN